MENFYSNDCTVQHIDGGMLLSDAEYRRLKEIEYEWQLFSQALESLEIRRGEQNEALHYWLDPDGGYAKMLERMDEQERDFVNRMMKNPHTAWRVRYR